MSGNELLLQHLPKLLESGLYSDLTIKCKEHEWKVHRMVVCTQSKPFAAAINGSYEEAKTGVINMDEHDPDTVDQMIKFFYYGDYDLANLRYQSTKEGIPSSVSNLGTRTVPFQAFIEKEACSPKNQMTSFQCICFRQPYQDWSPEELRLVDYDQGCWYGGKESRAAQALLRHTNVYLLAEEKDIPALKTLAKQKYEAMLSEGWNSESFCTSLKIIWEGTPDSDRELWDVAVKMAGEKVKDLLNREDFVSLWKENGNISLEILKASLALDASKSVAVEKSLLAHYYHPAGCPSQGFAHAAFVGAGRNTKYWCSSCREAFD